MPFPPSPLRPQVDFVGHDVASLASHMQHCADAQGRWFAARHVLQQIQSVAAGRIVTIACIVTLIGIGSIALA